MTPLLLAIRARNQDSVEQLLAAGASTTFTAFEGDALLTEHFNGYSSANLCYQHSVNGIARALVRAGAPMNQVDYDGNSMLHRAALQNAEEVVQFLLEVSAMYITALLAC